MPFQSEKQRKYLWANEPEIAKRWEKYPKGYNTGGVSHLFRSKSAQGGYIRPEDSGVLGLADGGNIRLQPHTATDLLVQKTSTGDRPKYQPPGHVDAPAPSSSGGNEGSDQGHSRFEPGSGYYGETVTTPTTPKDDKDDRQTYSPHTDTPTQIAEQKKLDIAQDIKRRQEEKGGIEYYGQKKTLVEQQKLTDKTNQYILDNLQKLDPDKYYEDMNAFKKAIEIGKSIPTPTILGLLRAMYDEHKLTSEGKSILDEWKQYVGGPPGSNPEAYDALWLALEKRKSKYRYNDEEERGDGPDEEIIPPVNQYPSLEEMMAAARRAYEMLYGDKGSAQIPEDTSKRDAYLAAFREKYLMGDGDIEETSTEFIAQGGRVPGGYNTGGLSNLFRLKNT